MNDPQRPKNRILLVEDEALIALAEKQSLEKHGYDVITAYSGERAVETATQDTEISLVLMDIDLGTGIDGPEAAQRILKVRSLPIVFLTSHSEKEYVDRVKRITSYGYVLKNSGEFVLIESINMALQLFGLKRNEMEREKDLREKNAYLDFYRLAVDAMDDHKVSVVDSDYRYRMVNRRYSRDAGLPKEEIVGRTVAEMLGNDTFQAIKPDIDRCFAGEFVEYSRWFEYPEAGKRYMEVSYHPLRNERGEIDAIAGIIRDSTERKSYEEALVREQAFLSSVLDTLHEAIIVCDENGKITRFNETARLLHGLPEKPITSEQWAQYYDLYTADGTKPLPKEDIPLFRAFNGERVTNAEIVVAPENGTRRLMSCSGHQLEDQNGKKTGAVIAMHDITELKNSEEKYKRLVNNSPNMIMETDLDTHEIISCNPAMAKNLGYSIPEIEGKKIDSFIPPDILSRRLEASERVAETGEPQVLEDRRAGKHFHTIYVPIASNERRSIQTITIDMTERKEYENTLQKQKDEYELIFDNSMNGILFTSPDGRILSANRSACNILDISLEELREYGRERVVDTTDPRLPKALQERKKVGRFQGELRFRKGTGEAIPVELNSQVFENPDGEERSVIFFQDVSERKQKEEQLVRTLEEKDFLMRELNHRVKNNLSMVSSLISMKESRLGREADLTDLRNQVNAIQKVHETLQQSDDLSYVNLKEYVAGMLSSVCQYSRSRGVTIENNVPDILLPTQDAVSLGLIVNETATNAVKHGFTGDDEARFTVAMEDDSTGENYILTISNTGRPFPEDVDLDNPSGLGLQLVSALVAQLKGTLELQRSPNPVFTIRFPIPE